MTGHRVAIKRIRAGRTRDGLPSCAYAELRALQELRHANIVQVGTVCMLQLALTLRVTAVTAMRVCACVGHVSLV